MPDIYYAVADYVLLLQNVLMLLLPVVDVIAVVVVFIVPNLTYYF